MAISGQTLESWKPQQWSWRGKPKPPASIMVYYFWYISTQTGNFKMPPVKNDKTSSQNTTEDMNTIKWKELNTLKKYQLYSVMSSP